MTDKTKETAGKTRATAAKTKETTAKTKETPEKVKEKVPYLGTCDRGLFLGSLGPRNNRRRAYISEDHFCVAMYLLNNCGCNELEIPMYDACNTKINRKAIRSMELTGLRTNPWVSTVKLIKTGYKDAQVDELEGLIKEKTAVDKKKAMLLKGVQNIYCGRIILTNTSEYTWLKLADAMYKCTMRSLVDRKIPAFFMKLGHIIDCKNLKLSTNFMNSVHVTNSSIVIDSDCVFDGCSFRDCDVEVKGNAVFQVCFFYGHVNVKVHGETYAMAGSKTMGTVVKGIARFEDK